MRKAKYYACLDYKAGEYELAFLANSKRGAMAYVKARNKLTRSTGWKAVLVPLPNAEAYVLSQMETNRRYAAAQEELAL
jgi:hypothetical protein